MPRFIASTALRHRVLISVARTATTARSVPLARRGMLLPPAAVLCLLSCRWRAHPVQPRPTARRVPPPLAASRGGEDEALADLVAGLQPVLTRVLAAWYQPHVCAVRTGGAGQPVRAARTVRPPAPGSAASDRVAVPGACRAAAGLNARLNDWADFEEAAAPPPAPTPGAGVSSKRAASGKSIAHPSSQP